MRFPTRDESPLVGDTRRLILLETSRGSQSPGENRTKRLTVPAHNAIDQPRGQTVEKYPEPTAPVGENLVPPALDRADNRAGHLVGRLAARVAPGHFAVL